MPEPADAAARPAPVPTGVVIIRTHYLDEILFRRAEALRRDGSYEVVFAIDEREREWDSRDFNKIPLTRTVFERMELFVEEATFLWRFGDYVFYAARQVRPEAEFLWMMESDVVINAADPALTLRQLDAASRHDLLASQIGRAEPGWFWHRFMAEGHREVHRCFFPLVRLSGRAIDRLREVRRMEAASYAERERNGVPAPNDEAFVATVLAEDGFSAADFNRFGSFYSPETFNFYTNFNVHRLPPVDGTFYHSVLGGRMYLGKLARMPPVSLVDLLAVAEADPELAFEDCLPEFRRTIDAMIEGAPDGAGLVAADAAIGRALATPGAGRLVEVVAERLADAGKELALSRLSQDHPGAGLRDAGLLVNVARNRPALQSSTCRWSHHRDPSLDAAGANNGDRRMAYGCHTDEEDDPWWQVDLQAVRRIVAVDIINRRDMADRLAGFRIDASLDGSRWDTVHQDPGTTPTAEHLRIPLRAAATCRFLRLLIPGRRILHIVEFGALAAVEGGGGDTGGGARIDRADAEPGSLAFPGRSRNVPAMKRVAIGILASMAPEVLAETLRHWPEDQFSIYIHLDSKFDPERFGFVAGHANARIIDKRHKVMWGGFSIVDAEVSLMEAALAEPFDHFLLISDDAVPLLRPADIVARLSAPDGWVLLEPTGNAEVRDRYESFYCPDIGVSSPRVDTIRYDRTEADALLGLHLLLKSGKFPLDRLFWSSNWLALSRADVEYVVAMTLNRGHLYESFRYSMIPDEHYIQTLLGRRAEGFRCLARFMWADFSKDPKPYVLRELSDIREATEYGCMFARKIRDPALAREVVASLAPDRSEPDRSGS